MLPPVEAMMTDFPLPDSPYDFAQIHRDDQGLALDLHPDILCPHRPPPFPTQV